MGTPKRWYVTCTDKVLSSWGKARGKINKLVFLCDNLTEAKKVESNCQKRRDFKNINIVNNRPYYSAKTHYVEVKTRYNAGHYYN